MSKLPPIVAALILTLAACSPDAEVSQSRVERLKTELLAFQPDPAIVAFLAEEAAGAGIRSVRAVPQGGVPINGNRVFVQYGMTTSDGIIWLNSGSAGGRSVVNITHEIAHGNTASRTCGGHTSRWLNAYLKIAARYEERFPGARWSGTAPTARVMRNKTRYDIGGRCP